MYLQGRGVVAVTTHLVGDVVLLRNLVERERETVMDLVMEVFMMETDWRLESERRASYCSVFSTNISE